jgi:hypothetical protein
MDLTTTTIIAAIVAVVVVGAIIGLLNRPKLPPQKSFMCARCSKVAPHNDRTIEAWRRGTKALFCDSCHKIWLSAQPPRKGSAQPQFARATGPSPNRGCLGVLVLLVACPLALIALLIYA